MYTNKFDNMEQMNKSLETYSLPRLNHEGTENLNRPVRISNQNLRNTKSLGPDWKEWTATCKRTKLSHGPTPYTVMNSKWVTNLNIRIETLILVEEDTVSF